MFTNYIGCPNCKAKRIKCSEELPSCFNCVKKNYRCGYLDFPVEKLDHLRKKNEKRRLEQAQKIHYSPSLPLNQITPIQSSHGSHTPSPNISNNKGNESIKQTFIYSDPQIRYDEPLSNTTQRVEHNQAWNNSDDQNFHEISTVTGNNHSEVTLSGHIYQNMDPQKYLAIIQQPIADINSRISNQKEELVNAFIWESFNRLLDSSDGDFDPLTDTSKSTVEEIFDFNNINTSFNNLINPRSDRISLIKWKYRTAGLKQLIMGEIKV